MNKEVKVENRRAYIRVQITGEFKPKDRKDLDEAKRIILETFDEAKKSQILKLFFNASQISATLDTMDHYSLMDLLAKKYVDFLSKNVIQSLKMAFISNRVIITPRKFKETVSRNRVINMLITLEMQEANNWLEV